MAWYTKIAQGDSMAVKQTKPLHYIKVFGEAILDFIRVIIAGADEEEEPKRVLHKSRMRALYKCVVFHTLPLAATTTLSYLNLSGYFIGTDMTGSTTAMAQSMDRLALQVTAKLLELFFISSLGLILSDTIRCMLLFHPDGLPLGHLFANYSFSDLRFLLSQEFRAACLGFQTFRWGIFIVSLITLCSLLAVLVAPSAAVLLIPTFVDNWPAGGAQTWLNGDLNPTMLNLTSVQNPQCLNFTNINVTLSNWTDTTFADCPWAGYAPLADYFAQRRASTIPDESYSFGLFMQDFTIGQTNGVTAWNKRIVGRTWTVASNIAIGAMSRYIAGVGWCQAEANMLGTSTPQASSLWHLSYAQLNGTKANVEGKLPLVRAQCYPSTWVMNSYPAPNQVPWQPEWASQKLLRPFPILDLEGSLFRKPLHIEHPKTSPAPMFWTFVPQHTADTPVAQWVPIPEGPTVAVDGTIVNRYPTALLLVHLFIDWIQPSTEISCSIDTKWAPGAHVTDWVCLSQTTNQRGVLEDAASDVLSTWSRFDIDWESAESRRMQSWDRIELSLDWLNILTPPLSTDNTSWTTLSSVIADASLLKQQINIDYDMDQIYGEQIFLRELEAIVSSFVADGLSRIGWDANHLDVLRRSSVNKSVSAVGWNWNSRDRSLIDRSLLHGTATFMPNPPNRNTLGQLYDVDITVTGYGIRATGLTQYLSIAILYLHALLAVLHIVWTIYRADNSTSWSSLTDMLVLSQASPPPDRGQLVNTCAGVSSHETLRLRVRIREDDSAQSGSERLRLLVEDDRGKMVKEGEEYGSVL